MNRDTSAPHIWIGQIVQSQALNLAPALLAHVTQQCADCKQLLKTDLLPSSAAADQSFKLYELLTQGESLTFRNSLNKK